MTAWAIRQVRQGLYVPLELAGDLGVMPPTWLVRVTVAIDKPLLRALSALWDRKHGVSGS